MNVLGQRNAFGTLLASLVHTPFSHDAFLVVDLSNLSYRSLGHVIRTGSTPLAASKLHPGAGSNYRDHSLAQMTCAASETASGRNGEWATMPHARSGSKPARMSHGAITSSARRVLRPTFHLSPLTL